MLFHEQTGRNTRVFSDSRKLFPIYFTNKCCQNYLEISIGLALSNALCLYAIQNSMTT